jgi:hypothetical protein
VWDRRRFSAAIGGDPERHVETSDHELRAIARPDGKVRTDRGRHDDGARASREVDQIDDASLALEGDAASVERDAWIAVAA